MKLSKEHQRNLRRVRGFNWMPPAVAIGLVGLTAGGLHFKANYDAEQRALDAIRNPRGYVMESISPHETYWDNVNALVQKYNFPKTGSVRYHLEEELKEANNNKMLRPDEMIRVPVYEREVKSLTESRD